MRKCVLQILKLICVPGTIKAGEIYLAIKISFSELISAFFGTSSQVKNYIKFTFFGFPGGVGFLFGEFGAMMSLYIVLQEIN